VPLEEDALASAVLTLVQRPPLRAQLSGTGLASVRERTWEAALERLADGYRLALGEDSVAGRRVA
jgi:glycosyltransferase involved in cell wall biosynthesis